MIDISGIDKAELLKALHDNSKAQGMSFLAYQAEGLTVEECRSLLATQESFDYLQGRAMKVNLSGDELDPWGYDRDNGQGAASRIVAALRSQKAA